MVCMSKSASMMCGEWHLGSWLSLVVLAAKSNVPLAAVPVIYTNVHFCAAVLTEKQAGQRWISRPRWGV